MRSLLNALILALPVAGFAQTDEDSYHPAITAEQAALTARKALTQNRFNPKRFEIRSIEYLVQIFEEETEEQQKANGATDKDIAMVKAFLEEFGNGPAWIVRFSRTEKVSETGNWYDDISFGLSVYVFPNNRAALIDKRAVKDPGDQVAPEPAPGEEK